MITVPRSVVSTSASRNARPFRPKSQRRDTRSDHPHRGSERATGSIGPYEILPRNATKQPGDSSSAGRIRSENQRRLIHALRPAWKTVLLPNRLETPSFCVLVTGLPKASDTFLAASSAAASSANSAKKAVGFFLRIFDAPDIRSFIFERRRMMAAWHSGIRRNFYSRVHRSGKYAGRKD
jgi:hypothetical protein